MRGAAALITWVRAIFGKRLFSEAHSDETSGINSGTMGCSRSCNLLPQLSQICDACHEYSREIDFVIVTNESSQESFLSTTPAEV